MVFADEPEKEDASRLEREIRESLGISFSSDGGFEGESDRQEREPWSSL